MFYDFPYIGNNNPNWRSYFSEGLKPPASNWGPPVIGWLIAPNKCSYIMLYINYLPTYCKRWRTYRKWWPDNFISQVFGGGLVPKMGQTWNYPFIKFRFHKNIYDFIRIYYFILTIHFNFDFIRILRLVLKNARCFASRLWWKRLKAPAARCMW